MPRFKRLREANDVAQLGGEGGIVGQLEQMHAVRLQAMRPPDSLHLDALADVFLRQD
jgi:hypothetical protein